MIVVSDTSPISNLIVIGKLSLLQKVFGTIVIPESVYAEIKALQKFNFNLIEFTSASWIIKEAIHDTATYQKLVAKVDEGEAQAITLAKELHPDFLLIVKRKAEPLQKKWELKPSG